MASEWYTHTIDTSIWSAGTNRGANVQGSWSRGVNLIKILNEGSPEIDLGKITNGELRIDEFSGWNSTAYPTLDVVDSGDGSSAGGYSGMPDPSEVGYSIGSTWYSGYNAGGFYGVQQLAEGYWVEITGARIRFED